MQRFYSFTISIFIFILLANIFGVDSEVCKHKCKKNFEAGRVEQWGNIQIYVEYTKAAVLEVPKVKEEVALSIPGLRSPDFSGKVLRSPSISFSDIQNTEGINTGNFIKYELTKNNMKQAECSSNVISQKVNKNKIRCTPRPILVDLVSEDGQVYPRTVLTKKCSGVCNDGMACESRTSTNKTIHVQIIPNSLKEQVPFCRQIVLPQDTKCKCACAIKKKDCSPQQNYNKTKCTCECNNKNEYQHCQKKIKKINKHKWNDENCSCVCRIKTTCSTGFIWDEKICGCTQNKAKRSIDGHLASSARNIERSPNNLSEDDRIIART